VRRKCVDNNKMLYAAVLNGASAANRRRVIRPLAEMDAMAQLINDVGDYEDDRTGRHLNAFADGVFRIDEAPAMLDRRRRRIWNSVADADDRVRGIVAVMLEHLGSPRAHPGHRHQGVARRLEGAIDAGVSYLSAAQMAHGEFPTYWSETRNLGLVPHYESSPFITALALVALTDVPAPAIDRRQAIRFLASWREPSGAVRFLARGIDPDLDDTALVNYVLLSGRFDRWPYRELALRIAAMERLDGLFPTWIRADPRDGNDVDPCVTANALRFLAAAHIVLDDASQAVRRALTAAGARGTLYYESPAALLYFIATLPPGARGRILSPVELADQARMLADRFIADPDRSPIDVAMILTAASLSGVEIGTRDTLARLLLDWQGGNGAWPSWAAFRAFNYWGSPALTTALAVQALVSHRSARE
jgi:hypothetical protein